MAVTNFIPEVWSANILSALQTRTVAAGVVNRNYEGDITGGGDTVHITNVTDPTVGDYSRYTDITIENVGDGTQSLVIDQEKYFAFQIDDVDAAQAVSGGAVMQEATTRAAYQLKNTLDKFLLGLMVNGGELVGSADTAVSTAAAAYELLVDMAVALDENDVPEEDRFAVVTPSFHGLLLKDDRFVKAGDDPSAASRQNGRVGEAAGLSIHKSNNLPTRAASGVDVTAPSIVAGSRIATTLAEQVVKTEAARKEKGFADIVKGLHVYGAKLVRPTAVVVADLA